MSAGRRLLHWLVGSEWRAHPVRALVAIAAIALGVALGFAIHLINAAAFNEFSAAVKSLAGQSDLQVRGTQATFDESIYPALARRAGVAEASPVLEVEAGLADRQGTLKILGIDVFRAAAVTPDLTGVPQPEHAMDTLGDDTIFLSTAAMEWLQVKIGDSLRLRSGTQIVTLRITGSLAHARSGQRIAVMDIGALQWRFDRLGRLSHVDLKLAQGVDRAAFREALGKELQGRLLVSEIEDQEARSANMSRAYRVNLNVLALVALFTGAFLVFSTQAMSVIRRRGQFALLRVVGVTRRQLMLQVLAEGGLLGVLGSIFGLGGGYALAAAVLKVFGGDLGGGYFPGVTPAARFQPLAACVLFLAGTLVALLGSAAPAWEAVQARPGQALKAGAEDVALAKLASPWPALLCLVSGGLFAWLPPVSGLPLFGYLAVALLLIGGIALMPRFAAWAFGALSRRVHPKRTVVALALARLANAPNQASIALGGVLSSFSLMVAMAIMVASFRVSVDDWLGRILPAAVYLRSTAGGDTGALKPAEQQAIAAVDGIARIDFLRTAPLVLDPARPGVVLIARPIDAANPGAILPLIGDALPVSRIAADAIPVWVSEAMTDLYGFRTGMRVKLPFQGGTRDAVVAGIWRDYARQSGAIQMRLEDYRAVTGDRGVTDAGIWLQPGTTPAQVVERIRRLPFGNLLEFAEPGDIRAISLKIFDRSFAVTYLLEIVAMVIGLFGVATTFSAQTLARAKEFGMLRHVGVMRRQILGILALEGGLLTVAGIVVGFVLGLAISLILVFVVNPQSFHWTMRLHLPWGLLGAVAALLLVASATTALAAGRHAVSGDAVRAVREDW